jgi:hypothetical protein
MRLMTFSCPEVYQLTAASAPGYRGGGQEWLQISWGWGWGLGVGVLLST